MTSKLIACLAVLTKEEWISFRKYLLMKTGEESDNFLVFKALQKRKLKLAEIKNADQIYQDEFSQMSQKAFANLLSRLTGWLEEWLVFFDGQQNKWQHNLKLVEGFNKRGLYPFADQLYHKTLKQIKADESVSHDKTVALLHKAQYYSDNPIKHAKGAALLEDTVHAYVQWHSKQSAMLLAELYNWGDIQHVEFAEEKEMVNKIIIDEKMSPAYRLMNKLVSEKEPTYLLQLVKEIESGKIKEGSETHIIMLNYCLIYLMRLTNQGKINDPDLLLKLYTMGMNTGAFFSNGKIPMIRFHNIANAISTCVTKEECEQFIGRWHGLVCTDDVESNKNVTMAMAYLNYGAYSEIISLLRGINYEDKTTKYVVGALLSIAYYEDGDTYYDVLLDHNFNYKRQLKRNRDKISNKLYHAYYNLNDFIEKLSSQNCSVISKIDLADYPYLMFRSWANKALQKAQA